MTTQALISEETERLSEHEIVSAEEWLVARKDLLSNEKQLTRLRDKLAAERRALPWVQIEKEYVFDAPDGKVTLADLFDGRSQLVIYHFMFGPDWQEGCPSCSFVSDHVGGALAHLAARDVTMVMVSRAPLAKIEAFKKRMGWQFKWVSAHGSDFNADFHVSFTKDEMAQGTVNYNYTMQEFPGTRRRALASSTRTPKATSSTPTPPSDAASMHSLAHTRSLTSCPRAGTRTAWASLWNGSDTMIVTALTSSPTRTSLIGRRPRRDRPRPAAVDRRRRTCERAPLLPGQDASRRQGSSARVAMAPGRRDCQLDCSRRNPRAAPQMPAVPGGIRGGLD